MCLSCHRCRALINSLHEKFCINVQSGFFGLFLFYKIVSPCVVQAGVELVTLLSQSPSAGITEVDHHTQL
jgi:hypothetical protein